MEKSVKLLLSAVQRQFSICAIFLLLSNNIPSCPINLFFPQSFLWWLSFRSALDGECGFLAANLYAKSVFGEDALVNVSIEKQADGKLSGYIRIRSKTQGIALSLGDKITLKQKGGS